MNLCNLRLICAVLFSCELLGGKLDFRSVFFGRCGNFLHLILELKKAQIQKALLPSKKSKMKKHGIYIVLKNNSFVSSNFFSNKFGDCRKRLSGDKSDYKFNKKEVKQKTGKKEDAAKFHKICFLERK